MEEQTELVVLHVATDMNAWEFYSEDALYAGVTAGKTWPLDRVVSEATLELNRFLERHRARKSCRSRSGCSQRCS